MDITFTQDKVTKNMVRFTQHEGPIRGSIFVAKDDELSKQQTVILTLTDPE